MHQLSTSQAVIQRNHIRIIGDNKPTLLFCHGFGCTQHIWQYLTPALAAHYQLILFDHVGAGGSDLSAYNPTKYASLEGYAQDVVEICAALDLHDVVVIGHSIGATIAMLAAIQAPTYFRQVMMLSPSPCFINDAGYLGGFERDDVNQLLTLMDADYNSWANMFANLLMGPSNPPSIGEDLAGYFCSMDTTIAKQFARVSFLSDYRPQVSQVSVPTVVLQCSEDVVAPREVGDYLLHHLPDATLVTLRATGHCPHLSAPVETLTAMERFLPAMAL
ncbi:MULTISPECIES: alpha/beta fold hydrolase [Hymenobacter]|uniref:Sigma-B regulation protein RsbQ n=1 Tax=Hymenobacter mucosus TaxID=1411120 RepID=A0A239ALZ5_9BACT|nr:MULTISPECIES: alpha/beta hydrolase [Hymenobacter]SNR96530.1 sigma-B regulation protein RsbQ [Hymenobacter mucosus]